MPLLTLTEAGLAYGDLPLLDRAAFALEAGERVGLIGRNGTGKSSLLSVIAGATALESGELTRRDGLSIAWVGQEPQLPDAPTLKESLVLCAASSRASPARSTTPLDHKLNEYLHRFGVDPALDPAAASGGERKRGALALAFAQEPEVLLLDEPTNHLDIDGILQLEALLQRQSTAIVITHDRAFLDRVVTRIVELDRGTLRSYPGDFSAYERAKAGQLAAEALAQRKFDKFWAEEEAWIRRGIEARRTRNEGRVRRLEHLREERAARRERLEKVKLAVAAGERSGKLVAELTDVSISFAGRPIVRKLDLRIRRGDRVGLIGANGAGKTTLLRLILGTLGGKTGSLPRLVPDSGSVRLGTNLRPAYFDQMRAALDPAKTVAETIAPGSDWIETAQGRKHVMSYLGDFLFPPRRAQSPVRMLSGGERNRLLLARLFAQPANVLVLDEPTNDLDIESLELLEAALQDYDGTLLLVSHDRAFLDNVITQTLATEGGGAWQEYVGGYSDWVRQRREIVAAETPSRPREGEAREARRGGGRAKLSYKETRELEALPGELAALEAEQKSLAAKMGEAGYYRQGAEVLRKDQQRVSEIEALLHQKLERWEALETKAKAANGQV